MILDDVSRASLYFGLHPRLHTALAFLQSGRASSLPPGRHAVDGDNVFALISDYDTKPEAESVWEAHQQHVDVQSVLSGEELMGVTPLESLERDPYDADRDILFARGRGEFVSLAPGRFIILFQHDAHMPGVAAPAPALSRVRKLVIKVKMNAVTTSTSA